MSCVIKKVTDFLQEFADYPLVYRTGRPGRKLFDEASLPQNRHQVVSIPV